MNTSLSDRQQKVLFLTVYYYISSGEPVGSRFLSRKLDLDLSPATIRNIMADLEEMGLLKQTHPSSGRVPTDQGYRSYVNLMAQHNKPRQRDIDRINRQFCRPKMQLHEIVEESSRTLSRISRNLGLALAPRFINSSFEHLEFIRLGRGRILAIFVSDSGMIQNRILEMQEDWSQEALSAASRIWNERFATRPLREVRGELTRLMAEERLEYDRLMEQTLQLAQEVLSGQKAASLYMDGAANVFNWLEFANPQKLQTIMSAIEEKNKLLQLLDQSLLAEGIQIYIGNEIALPGCRI